MLSLRFSSHVSQELNIHSLGGSTVRVVSYNVT